MTKPVALIICDGWGINDRTDHNAIALAKTPHFDEMKEKWGMTRLHTSGLQVGLPEGQMGNSEVGHMNMGAGRIVYQELTRIDKEIREWNFFRNPTICAAIDHAAEHGTQLHLIGLLSDGGVHSSMEHMFALLNMAKARKVPRTFVHAFLDGRDVPPKSGAEFLAKTEQVMQQLGHGKLATMTGRYWAMDRDKNWERTERAYRAMIEGVGNHGSSAAEAIQKAYDAGITDEFVEPTILDETGMMRGGDAVIFFNFRPDRARQITRALALRDFTEFPRFAHPALAFASMTQYDAKIDIPVAYRPQELVDSLAQVLSERGLKQLHTAETEKYAHVTFFFNCGQEDPFPGEERLLVPSPKIATYDLKPEMAAPEVAAGAAAAIAKGDLDFLILNFANADMVGHTGNMAATIKAVEAVDAAVGKVVAAVLKAGGVALVTADHGNAEQMVDYVTGQPFTSHTTNPVPLYIAGSKLKLRENGVLADVAPTILELLEQEKPAAMTATSLLQH